MSEEWTRRCVLCASRGKVTKLEAGHCCVACASWLTTTIADIARLAADAAAWVTPGSSGSGSGHTVPASKPPLNVESLDPENALVPGYDASVLQLCESWERMIRDMRGMAPYGPASAARLVDGMYAGTTATLVGCVTFLGRSVPWAISEPDFPLDDLADEMRACVRVLRRWDVDREDLGTMVKCPTLNDEGECGYRLYYADVHEDVTCRRCGATRSAMTLAAVAMADGREVWLDPEAASQWLGVTEGTLRQWARMGKVERSHGRYLVRTERITA